MLYSSQYLYIQQNIGGANPGTVSSLRTTRTVGTWLRDTSITAGDPGWLWNLSSQTDGTLVWAQVGSGGGGGSGFPLTSDGDANGFKITNLGNATAPGDALSLGVADGRYIRTNGSTPLTANWDVGGFILQGLGAPSAGTDAVNVNALNAAIGAITGYVKTDGSTPMTAGWNYGGFALTNVSQLGVGTNAPGASAAVQIDSTTRGLLPPRLTTTQRDAVASPATGLTVYNTTTLELESYNGTSWATPTVTGFVRTNGSTPLTASWDVGGFPVVDISSLGVGVVSPAATALAQFDSTTKGVLPPRLTTTQRNAIVAPATGLTIYNTTTLQLESYNGTSWATPTVTGFVKTDGSTPLTASWNVGGFNVTNIAVLGVGVASPGASALAQLDSTTKGFLPPRMTTTQRNAIVSPAVGLEIYNTTADQLEVNKNVGGWTALGSGDAHLAGTETFTGQKTFTGNLIVTTQPLIVNSRIDLVGSGGITVGGFTVFGSPSSSVAHISVGASGFTTTTLDLYGSNNVNMYTSTLRVIDDNFGVDTASFTTDGSPDTLYASELVLGGVDSTIESYGFTLRGAAAAGTNITGGDALIQPGRPTGNSTAVHTSLYGTVAVASGAGQHTLVESVRAGGDAINLLLPTSVGTSAAPNSKAILDLVSTTKGFLPPRMTSTQRDAIASPATGLTIYNLTTLALQSYNGTVWV